MTRHHRAISIRLLTALALLAALAVARPPAAEATTYNVTSGAGTGPNTFVAALQAASADNSGPHTVNFTPGLEVSLTATPTYSGDQALTINGNGAVLDGGGGNVRAIEVTSFTPPVTVNDLTVQDMNPTDGSGGALTFFTSSAVEIHDSTITGNHAPAEGGGISQFPGSLLIEGSTLSDNSAGTYGGGAYSYGQVTVIDSTFTDNSADAAGGAIWLTSHFTVTGSLFVQNTAPAGGGIRAPASTAPSSIANSTFVGNTSTGTDPTGNALDVSTTDELAIDHSFFRGNTGNASSGQLRINSGGDASLTRSVLTAPGANSLNCVGLGAAPTTGYTLSSDESCHTQGLLPGDSVDVTDPVVGKLRDNGGPVMTRFPLAGSPLVDAIPNADCSLTTDGRGVSRPFPTGGACDIGPVEATYPPHAFNDVPNWVTDAVAWINSPVNDPQLMTGITPTKFKPDDNITRAQVVRLLYRLMGEPSVNALPAHPFTDVPPWVEDAVRWASANEIVTGITPTTFEPDDPITRAQVVRMEYRTVDSPDVSGYPAHPFTDVPNWVTQAVTWAANTDNPLPLVTGITPTTFKPNDNITRAQVARLNWRLAITPDAWADPQDAPGTVPFQAPSL